MHDALRPITPPPVFATGGSYTRLSWNFLEAEIEQEVDARALDPPEQRARRQRLGVGEGGAQPEQARKVILHGRLVVGFLAELAAEARDQAGCDLVPDGDLD